VIEPLGAGGARKGGDDRHADADDLAGAVLDALRRPRGAEAGGETTRNAQARSIPRRAGKPAREGISAASKHASIACPQRVIGGQGSSRVLVGGPSMPGSVSAPIFFVGSAAHDHTRQPS
jgi:hypothetical protein